MPVNFHTGFRRRWWTYFHTYGPLPTMHFSMRAFDIPMAFHRMSKALMEKCMVAKARMYGNRSTIFCGTRYGNVMASRGS